MGWRYSRAREQQRCNRCARWSGEVTRARDASIGKNHVLREFGAMDINRISGLLVHGWLNSIGKFHEQLELTLVLTTCQSPEKYALPSDHWEWPVFMSVENTPLGRGNLRQRVW